MNEINEKVANYESHLRDAERNIERALQSICDVCGTGLNEVHKDLYAALELVRAKIHGTYKFYDNPDLKIVK